MSLWKGTKSWVVYFWNVFIFTRTKTPAPRMFATREERYIETFNQKSWVWLRFNDPLNKLLLLSPGFFPPGVFFCLSLKYHGLISWGGNVPRGEGVGWPAFTTGETVQPSLQLKKSKLEVTYSYWDGTLDNLFGWQIVVEKTNQIPSTGTTGGTSNVVETTRRSFNRT